jgi:hypothetical protein
VLNVSMSGKSGLSGLDVLCEMGIDGTLTHIPVVAFSAGEECRGQALQLGAVGFVPNHDPGELTTEIQKHFNGHGKRVQESSGYGVTYVA